MKKLIAAAAVLLCCLSANAQIVAGVGYSRTTINEKLASVEYGPFFNNAFYAELGYDLSVNHRTSILAMAQAGTYIGNDEAKISMCNKDGNFYLKVPVYAKYIVAADSDFKLFVYGGPEYYYTLSNSNNGFGWVPGRVKRSNVSIGAGIGGDILKHYRVKIGYDWGLLNEYVDDMNGNLTCHSNDFNIGVSYVF